MVKGDFLKVSKQPKKTRCVKEVQISLGSGCISVGSPFSTGKNPADFVKAEAQAAPWIFTDFHRDLGPEDPKKIAMLGRLLRDEE